MASIPLPIASYVLSSPSASCSRLLNCHVEEAPPRSMKGDAILRRGAGIDSWVDLEDADGDTVRGLTKFQDTLYALVGTELSSIAENGDVTSVGTVPGGERVRIVNNGDDMVIWRPFNDTLYGSDGASVAQITDPVVLDDGAASPAYLDGYIVHRVPDTDEFRNSGLNALTWNGLDVASAEAEPGNLVGLIVDNRELIVGKSDCAELWYNAGNPTGSPFSRSPNGFVKPGVIAGESMLSQDNSPFWLASDQTFRRLQGVTLERVSQHGIEAVLAAILLPDAYAVKFHTQGHLFIAWIFPSAGRTLVYDCTTKQWHERDSLGYGAWRPNHIVECYGRQIVGDRVSGKIGFLDAATFDEFDEPQRVSWTYQPVYAEAKLAVHKMLELVPNTGRGTAIGQGMNPLATLKISDDGGNVFRTHTTQSLGVMGAYRDRLRWPKLGSSRNRVYRIDVTDPVELFALDTQLDVVGARS